MRGSRVHSSDTALGKQLPAPAGGGDLEAMIVQMYLDLLLPPLPWHLLEFRCPRQTLSDIIRCQYHLVPQLPEPVALSVQGVGHSALAELKSAPSHDHGESHLPFGISFIDHLFQSAHCFVDHGLGELPWWSHWLWRLLLGKKASYAGEATSQSLGNSHWGHAPVEMHLASDSFFIRGHARRLLRKGLHWLLHQGGSTQP